MRLTMDQIVNETREWPEEDVAELVDRIYRVRYGEIPLTIEASWHGEVRRRVADLESGRVQGIPLEETLAKARAMVGRGSDLTICEAPSSDTHGGAEAQASETPDQRGSGDARDPWLPLT